MKHRWINYSYDRLSRELLLLLAANPTYRYSICVVSDVGCLSATQNITVSQSLKFVRGGTEFCDYSVFEKDEHNLIYSEYFYLLGSWAYD